MSSQRRRLIHIDQELRKATDRRQKERGTETVNPGSLSRLPNCGTLAADLEVSPKTIQRDIDFLRDEEGAPVAYDHRMKGYYYKEKNYSLPAISIKESDLFAICIAEKALKQYQNTPLYGRLEEVFNKIQASLPEQVTVHPSWVDRRISFIRDPSRQISGEIWETTARALRENRRLLLKHQSPTKKKPTVRRVDPYHMVSFRGEWYLIGHCHKMEEIRCFGMSRIRHAEILADSSFIPEDFDAEKLFARNFGIIWGDKTYRVRIRFNEKAAPYIRECIWHKLQTLKENRDGSVVLSFETSHLDELTLWVLSWGQNAKVLSPIVLQDKVKDELQGAVRVYG